MASPSPVPPLLVLLLLLCTAAAAAAAATTCQPGTKRAAGATCVDCSPGSYAEYSNSTSCSPCPRSTFSTVPALVDRSLCRPCPSTSISSPGSTACTPCPHGRVASCASCIRCPAGSHLASCRCTPCPPGAVSVAANSAQCAPCDPGFVPNAKRDACVFKQCAPGREARRGRCVPCRAGQFRRKGYTHCSPCAPRTVPNAARNKCVPCKPGFFFGISPFSVTGVATCMRCASGSKTSAPGKSVCRRMGHACPADTFKDQDGDCDSCLPNYRFVSSVARCRKCPPNTVSEGGVATRCFPCYQGQVRLGGHCVCPAGSRLVGRVCRKCPRGTFNARADSLARCLACPMDSAAPAAGATKCTPCAASWTSDASFGKRCRKPPTCPPGFMIPPPGSSYFASSVCIGMATGCPRGLSLSRWIRRPLCVNAARNVVCPRGFAFDGYDRCLRCYPGSRLSPFASRLQCQRCSGNSIGAGGLATTCETCKGGLISLGTFCSEVRPPWAIGSD